jgi:ketopantoate reductase
MSDKISAGPENTPNDVMVVGIGGIGGLMSAPLVGAFGSRIHLVETGPRKVALLRHGLTIASDVFGHVTVQPADVTDSPRELPHCDLILICVKNPSPLPSSTPSGAASTSRPSSSRS